MHATLCLNMIVRNEAPIIARCLGSVARHVGCWVIGDTGSTDRTPQIIAEFFAARGIPGELHRFAFVDFQQARNEALERARASPLAFDYLLLIDADMELVVHDPAFRGQLTAPAYSCVQKAGISYWNTRLLGRDAAARYRGATHEYVEVRGQQRLAGIGFVDHAEGSSRVEKFARDIRLLEQALAEHPDDARAWFYLAQSLRDSSRWEEAAAAYRRRIALGGWAEESWYARLQLARCLLRQGDEGGFVRQALAAWSERPQRAEPLYDLARFHRERGLHAAAVMFARAGLRLPRPEADTLFIEDWVYAHALREEFAIAGYYRPDHRAQAAATCDALALSPQVPRAVRQLARRNLRFYARPLAELLPSFAAAPVGFVPPPPYRAMNPSIVRWDGALWLVQRTVNYELTEAGHYVTADAGPVRTRNFLLRLDDALRVCHCSEILPPAGLPAPAYGAVLGFEDLRPFVWHGQLWVTATLREQNPEGRCETVLARLDQTRLDQTRLDQTRLDQTRLDQTRPDQGRLDPAAAATVLAEWQVLRPSGPGPQPPLQHEKNWMPVASGNDVRFIHTVSPTRILDAEARLLSHTPSPWAGEQLRGGSQAVAFGPGWLALCHEHVASGRRRHYLHRFVWFDRAGGLRRISPPVTLQRPGVEFAAGLAWHPDGRRLVLSFGVGDGQSWLGHCDAAELPALLAAPTAPAAAAAACG